VNILAVDEGKREKPEKIAESTLTFTVLEVEHRAYVEQKLVL